MKSIRLTLGRALLAIMLAAGTSAGAAMPAVGDTAPAVAGQDQEGNQWNLADFKGRKAVLLYFYPKDDTPGCTKQACGLRDRMGTLRSSGVEVVGVSFDTASSHRTFIEKHDLNFTLIADTEGKIADAFGVRMPNRDMARRVSFLINTQGRIVHVTDSPRAELHLDEMGKAVAALGKV